MAEAENPSSGFEIAGEVYEVPRLETLNLDEAELLYDLSGVTVEDFIPAHPDASLEDQRQHYLAQMVRTRSPRFRRALVHIAYRRKHEQYDYEELDKAIGVMNASDVSLALLGEGDVEDPSQSSPKQPDEKSSTNGTSSESSSGSPSGSDSGRLVAHLRRTGTGASASPSQASHTKPSAA